MIKSFIISIFILIAFSIGKASNTVSAEYLALAKQYNLPEYYNHPEFGVLPHNTGCFDCVEDLSKRTVDSRYYIEIGTDGRGFIKQQAKGALHYKDENGWWRTIDTKLEQSANPDIYTSKNTKIKSKIDLGKGFISLTSQDELKFNNNLRLLHQPFGQQATEIAPAKWKRHEMAEKRLVVRNIFDHIDMRTNFGHGKAKTNFVIKNKMELSGSGYLIIEDNISIPSTLEINHIVSSTPFIDDIIIHDQDDKEVFKIHEAFAYDNNFNSIPISYRIADENTLQMLIPIEWLNAEETSYPIYIDPLVESRDTIVDTTLFSSRSAGCPHTFTMLTPAEVTITDILFDVTINIDTPCTFTDAEFGFNLTTGGIGCNANFICQQPTGPPFPPDSQGRCTTTVPTSIFAQLGTCVPAPACEPYEITYTLFLRRTDGQPGTCNPSCIQIIDEPWIMIMRGLTVEALSITPSNAICHQIEEDTLFAEGIYGVPPYKYQWFPDGFIDSTNDGYFVRPDTNTTYKMIVIDECGNKDSLTTSIFVIPRPEFDLEDPSCLLLGTSITLNDPPVGGVTYEWQDIPQLSCFLCPSPQSTPTENFDVFVRATDPATGCYTDDNISITVCEKYLEIPSAFTPNGDGDNDVFFLITTEASTELIQYEIFNRWGKRVFLGENITDTWDGTHRGKVDAEIGTYFVYASVKAFDGEILRQEGVLELIR